MDNSFKVKKAISLEPTALVPTVKGDLTVDSASGDMHYHNGTVVASVSTDTNTQVLENKSISGNDNTLTDIPASALVPLTANKAVASDGAGGLVASATTDTELGYVSGVTSAIQTQLNNKQATGNYITALTGDVTASGPGSVAGTVASVGGSSAANVNSATVLANAATDANTPSTIVKRDANGDFDISSVTMVELGSTPSTPASNTDKLYFKTDGKFYKLNDLGVEKEIGGNPVSDFTIVNNQVAPANVTGFVVDPLENRAFSSEISIFRRYLAAMTGTVNTQYSTAVPAFNGDARGMCKSGTSMVVIGDFSTIGGVPSNRITKIKQNGLPDSVFQTNVGALGFSSVTLDIRETSSGDLIVVGGFTSYAGTSTNRIAKLNSDGVLDTAFSLNIPSMNNFVYAVAPQSDGKIVVGGTFTNLGVRLGRLNSDGTEDTTFTTNLGTGFDAVVSDIDIDSTGKIVVVGSFTTFNGNARSGLVRLNSDGTEDVTFYTNATGSGLPVCTDLSVVKVQPDDKVLIAGADITAFNGSTAYGIVRLLSTGVPDSAFITNTSLGFGSGGTYGFRSFDIGPTGKIIISGGNGVDYDGYVNLYNITQINDDGTTDTVFATNYSLLIDPVVVLYNGLDVYISKTTTGLYELVRLGNLGTELIKEQTLRGVFRTTSLEWEIGAAESIGDDAGITFSMTSAGQLRYTSTNIAGTVADSFMKFTIQPL